MRSSARTNSIPLRLLGIALVVALAAPSSAQLGGVDGSVDGAVDGSVDDAVDGSVDGTASGTSSGAIDGAVDGTAGGSLDGLGGLDLSGEVSALVQTRAELEAEAEAWAALSEAERTAARAEAEASGLWSHFEAEASARAGGFATVTVDAADGALRGHAVSNGFGGEVRFLDGIDLEATGGAEFSTAQVFDTGESVALWADGVRVEAKDRADGSIIVQAAQEPVELTIELSAGTDALPQTEGWVRLESAGQDAGLSIAGDGDLDTSAAASGTIHVRLEPWAQLRFEAREESESEDDFEESQEARQESRVGGGARITSVGGALSARLENLSVELAADSERDNEVTVTVSSDDPRPRIVEIALDSKLFANASRIGMTFDGEPAVRANSAAQVYAGDHAETTYSLIAADGHYSAVVWVEGFSTHELAFRGEGGGAGSDSSGSGGSGGSGGTDEQSGGASGAGSADKDEGGLVDVGAPGPALPLVALGLVGLALFLRRR